MPCILLIDNGSLRANATLQLRKLAEKLSIESGHKIHPVSCKHSNRIPAEDINGIPANTFGDFMKQQLSAGEREFILLPLFFGNSRALTSFIPDEVVILEEEFGKFEVKIADTIYPLPQGEPDLSDIIYDHVIATSLKVADGGSNIQNVVLVDHGSPVPRVTAVRQHLADSVREKLVIHQVDPKVLEEAVMERREGKEYDFNGDLLEKWLTEKAQAGETQASVILMFFLPGSHAGEGGDIVEICDAVMDKYPKFKISISPLISEHPKLISILNKRLENSLKS
ncbi:sirohydrochlorin chelatase [uncultured Cocleimonas sp.]|uniref:sirohydrochlorin chelatase n=1 Tax=uncultured Cocleimonas sp. TaxID=1051587 RepID=UPI00262BCDF8|nr:CbiX/SirB N-terminal domain-containing protein [uncultured Cocleimonas sp.]